MKIGFDARMWSQTGIGRYVRNICINLQKLDSKNEYVLFIRKEDKEKVGKIIKNKNWNIVEANYHWHSISEQISFPRTINKQNVDVMHFTYQQGVPVMYKKSYVMTIHDLIKHHFMTGKASTYPLWFYGFKMLVYKILMNLASKNAKKIISISNSTREEIFDHLMVSKNNVDVIYEGADDFQKKIGKNPELGKYFLFVGNVYPHKNTDTLLKAFELVLEKSDAKLVFAGSDDYFYKRLKGSSSKLIKNKKVVIFENESDEKLSALYEYATSLVRPSLMEGFSLPPLEAMSMGCPVIVSDIPVHKEVLGDAAFYFNPDDFVDLSEKMLYVLNLDKRRKELKVKEGKKQVNKYSWEDAAKKTLSVYESSIA